MTKKILYLGLDPSRYLSNGQVTHWPIIQIVPRPLSDPSIKSALNHFEAFTHVIATSKSTVAILIDYLEQLNIPLHRWAAKETLAVGQATAKHLNACGITPLKVAMDEKAEGIVEELKQLDLTNAHLFWPHSSKARLVIEEFCTSRAVRLTSCTLYDPKTHIPSELPQLKDFHEIVFTSPSTVDAFLEIFGACPSHACLTTIGSITGRYLNTIKMKDCLQ